MLFYTLNEKPEYQQEFIYISFQEWESFLKKININSAEELKSYYNKFNMTTYLLIEDHELLGFYSLLYLNDSSVMIANVWMHPNHRKNNKGVLVKHALLKIGNKKACLYSEKKLVQYYAKFGFKVTKYDEKQNLYLMENNYFDKIIFLYLIICAIIIGIIVWFIL
jgi:hypothetical protein